MKPHDLKKKILVYGIGNPGRGDDGLGWEVIARNQESALPQVEFCHQYQLQVEDALLLKNYEIVIFVDASRKAESPFNFETLFPEPRLPIYTHHLSPENLLGLCQELYSYVPQAHILGIRGYEWELKQEISPPALENLEVAIGFLQEILKNLQWDPILLQFQIGAKSP